MITEFSPQHFILGTGKILLVSHGGGGAALAGEELQGEEK